MDLMTRIGINWILLFVAGILFFKASKRIMSPSGIHEKCAGSALFQARLIWIWTIGFIYMTFDWMLSGRAYILPIHVELLWSSMFLLQMGIMKESIHMTEHCPLQRPLGEIIIERGYATEEEVSTALKIQSDEKGKVIFQ